MNIIPEACHVMNIIPEACHVMNIITEACHVMNIIPEACHIYIRYLGFYFLDYNSTFIIGYCRSMIQCIIKM
jgi:hypothetical protein